MTQKKCLFFPMSMPINFICKKSFQSKLCEMVSTTLKPQNLVQNRNSKTHLTNHCLGIRCGKKLLKVVEPQGVKYKSTFIYFNITEYTKRNQSRINKIDRKEYIL